MLVRIKIVFLVLCSFFLLLVVRLFNWQIVQGKMLSRLARDQYVSSQEILADRGKITSSDDFPLVLNQTSYLLYANPNSLDCNLDEIEKKLNQVTTENIQNVKLLENKKLYWVPLVKNVDEQLKSKIEELNIQGLDFEEKSNRFYPEASLAAHLLGFVAENEKGGGKGYFGLEGYYDNELKGKSGKRYFEKDAIGRPNPLESNLEEKSIPGRNLKLNLNRPLQFFVEKYLLEGVLATQASSGWVLVQNPQTGAILAAASYPNYNPQEYSKYEEDLYRDPLISSVFEPGSIFKVVVMASALDSGAVKPDDLCLKCSGPRKISDYEIKTWNEQYFPNSSITDIIIHSDNVGMVYVGEKLGRKHFYDYLEKFGFGKKTGIDLQGEISAELKKFNDFREIDLATTSFGQGIAITPIQMLVAVSAIANNGEIYQPLVVNSIFEEKKEILVKAVKKGRVISVQAAKQVTDMMVQMVEKSNVRKYKPEGYKIAGKSGTAQVPKEGSYDPTGTIASFVGFFPADTPQFSILVTLKEPKNSPWSEATAAPVWFKIAQEIIRLWDIKPNFENN